MFNIVIVPDTAGELAEQLGTKRKFWFQDDGRLLLFKEGRPGTGENWAEKLASELCKLIGLPHAAYELAKWKNVQGVASPSFVPDGSRLVLGNELLARVVRGYDPAVTFYKQTGHTVSRATALIGRTVIGPPHEWQTAPDLRRAVDVFIGYLLFDAWIGNTDRHDENWGVVVTTGPPAEIRLAPTFDHASSLGRNESDQKRRQRMVGSDPKFTVSAYADRARSAFFKTPNDGRPMLTFEAFLLAARRHRAAGDAWIQRLKSVTNKNVRDLLGKMPQEYMSDDAKEFAAQLLAYNASRLISGFDQVAV